MGDDCMRELKDLWGKGSNRLEGEPVLLRSPRQKHWLVHHVMYGHMAFARICDRVRKEALLTGKSKNYTDSDCLYVMV